MKLETSLINLLLFFFAFLNIGAFAQVQVGTGTTTEQALPIEPYFGYSYSQVIYLSSEINAPGDITELQWYFAGNSLSNSNNWTIYMGHTSKSSFTSTTDWVAVGSMTQVFSGTFTDPGAAGWITFDITDFYYNGTDNLVIAIDENASGYNDNSDDFYCTSTTAGRSIVYYNDGTNPDPSSPPPGNTKSYIANIIFGGIPQDCPYPTTQIETNVSTTQADLGWTENGTATTWNIEWGPTGFTQGSGTLVTGTTSNPHTLSGLSINTIYDWYVQADCGSDESAWIGPSTFTTPCNPFTATFAEGFDGVTTPDIPDCWSSIVNTSSSYPAVETTTSGSPNSTPNHIYLSNYGDVNATLMLITPPLSDLTSQSNQIRFWAKGSGEALIVGTMSDPANEATFTSYTTINFTNAYTYTEYTVMFGTTYTGTDEHIAFKLGSGNSYNLYIDDFNYEPMPSCPPPTAQTESGISATSADLGWTENGTATTWNIEWGATGFTQGSGTMITGTTTNPHTLTGLTATTTYDWYVQADCGSRDESGWIGPGTFTTPCDPFTATFAEGFDGVTEPDLPDCWSSIVNSVYSSSKVETTTSSYPHSTPNHVWLYNYADASATLLLITPLLSDLTSQSNQIRFWGKTVTSSCDLIVGTMSDPTDEATFTSFTTVRLSDIYTEYTVMFGTTYTGSDEYIAFKHGLGGTYLTLYIDDFNYEPMPACPPPTSQTETNVSETQADLGWTENGTATTWNIEWGPAGFTQGSGTMITGTTTNPHTLTGLTVNTLYDWYVQADCDGTRVESSWVGPKTFLTVVPVQSLPFIETWESGPPIGTAWNYHEGSVSTIEVNEASKRSGTYGLEQYGNGTAYSTPSDFEDAYIKALPGGVNEDFTTLNQFSVDLSSTTTPWFSFWYAIGIFSHSFYNFFWVQVSTDGSTWTDLLATNSNSSGSNSYEKKEYDLSTYNGTSQLFIRFFHCGKYDLNYLWLDDIRVQEDICAEPSDQTETNITTTSADLGWNKNGTATTWNIEWGPTGFTQGSGTMVTGTTTNPHTISGLSPATTYDWWLQSDCGGDQSDWIGPNTFTTVCDPFTATFAENFDGVTEPDLPNCWSSLVNPSYAELGTSTSNLPNSTPNHVRMYNSSSSSATVLLISPQLSDLTSQSNQIRFWAKGANGYDLIIGTMSNPADEATFTSFTTISLTYTYTEYVVMFGTTYIGSDEYIAFKHGLGGTYRYIYIDDFNYEPMPSCPPPNSQTETNIKATSADLGWTENGSATTWNIEWGPTGFTQGSGTMVTGTTTNPHTLTGIAASTTYDWYVQADCGSGDESAWVGPGTFSTACADVTTFPYTESYETSVPPDCWTEEIVTDNGTDPDWLYVSSGSRPSCSPIDGSYMAKFNSRDCPGGSEARLYTHGLNFTGLTGMAMSFWMYHDDGGSSCTSEGVQVQVSTDGSSWLDFGNFIQRFSTTESWVKHTFDLSTYDGQIIYIGFLGKSQDCFNMYIDGVNIHNSAPASATWSGGTDNDWSKDANWNTTDIPYPTTDVTIPPGMTNYPTIFAATECNNLTIESSASGDGSIIGDEYLTVNGTSTVQRYITGSTWHDLSASNQGQTVNALYQGGSPDVWLRTYNEPDNSRAYITELTDPLDPGAGFEVWVAAGPRYDITVDYTGTLQTTDVTLTTTSTPALSYSGTGVDDPDYGYNLIGNPFASPIDLDEGTWYLTNVNTSFWVWDSIYTGGGSGSGDYRDWNSSSHVGSLTDGIVPMGQGFFIQANNASPSITIPMNARVHSGQAYYKVANAGNEDAPIHIKLRAMIGEGFSEMNIAFVEGASEEFDIYDTRKMFTLYGAAPQVYSEKAGEKLSINGLPLKLLSEEGTVVNVGYRPGLDGMQTLEAKLDNLPNTEVFLEDKLIGNIQRLNDEPVYEFEADVGADPNRFFLHFNPIPTAIGNPDVEDLILVYAFDDKLCIRSTGDAANYDKEVWIYDMFGRTVIHTNAAASTFTTIPLHLLKGYVVVRIISESGVQTNKVYIK